MKRRGFKFVGPTIVYAWMQAVGIVNDHSIKCFRRAEVSDLAIYRMPPVRTRKSTLSEIHFQSSA